MAKGFIFSYDVVISMMFLVIFTTFLTYYVGSFSYSSFENYEIIRMMDSSVKTLISDGSVNLAVQREVNGQTNLAKNGLRSELRNIFGKRHSEKIIIDVYDSGTMNKVYSIESVNPNNVVEPKLQRVYSVRHVFTYEEYYGIVKLQLWE